MYYYYCCVVAMFFVGDKFLRRALVYTYELAGGNYGGMRGEQRRMELCMHVREQLFAPSKSWHYYICSLS